MEPNSNLETLIVKPKTTFRSQAGVQNDKNQFERNRYFPTNCCSQNHSKQMKRKWFFCHFIKIHWCTVVKNLHREGVIEKAKFFFGLLNFYLCLHLIYCVRLYLIPILIFESTMMTMPTQIFFLQLNRT